MVEGVFQDIIYEKKGGIARVIINRPEVYNAFKTHRLKELALAFEEPSMTAVRLLWESEEGEEGEKAFSEKRKADFSRYRK
jgi:1,4-dihydroxy-2-naphthoyl-CoA synthase